MAGKITKISSFFGVFLNTDVTHLSLVLLAVKCRKEFPHFLTKQSSVQEQIIEY